MPPRSRAPVPLAEAVDAWALVGSFWCRCGRPLAHPGLCQGCADATLAEEVRERSRDRARERIPAIYRWAKLGSEKLAAETRPKDIDAVRRWHSSRPTPTLMLRGDTHIRKSTIAAAVVRAEIDHGRDAFFVPACDLSPEAPDDVRARALVAAARFDCVVVFDDLASVLGGAPAGGGIAAQRAAALVYWLRKRWERKADTVLTTALLDNDTQDARGNVCAGIVRTFGEDIFARIRDHRSSTLVEMGRR